MQFVWLDFYLVTSFLKRHQESNVFIPTFLDIGQQQSQPVKYMLKGRKNRESSNELCQSLHSKTRSILSNIMAHLKGAGEEIEVMLTKSFDKEIQKNCSKLKPIVDSVILLGRLGLPFRGHRDDSHHHPNAGEYSSGGVGNFIECLGYRVRGGDTEVENHLKTYIKT